MDAEQVDREWMRGYDTARALCLKYSVEPAGPDLSQSPAFESGFSWAVFDWLDANGLPQPEPRSHRGA